MHDAKPMTTQRRYMPRTCLALAFALGMVFVASANPCRAASPRRSQDSIWLVSTRGTSNCCASNTCVDSFSYTKYTDDCTWQTADKDAFLAEDLQFDETVIYVHGNRVAAGEDRSRGMSVYNSMVPTDDARRIRYVIFSWPAAQIRGPLRDFREKAVRTVPAAYHMATLLAAIDSRETLGLVGYSYGGPIVTGALQLISGGRLESYLLPTNGSNEEAAVEREVRVVLLVPAQDHYTMSAGGSHSLAGGQIDRLLIFSNCCDRAMKWYHVVEKGSRPVALGYTGLSSSGVGLIKGTYEQADVCGFVGSDHSLDPYLCSPTIMSQAWIGLW